MTDADLLARYAVEGSHEAFATLVERHAGWVHAIARRQVRDPHLADDVAQAVFLLLAQRAGSIRNRHRVASWLMSATRYAANHATRGESRRRRWEFIAARSEVDDRQHPLHRLEQTETYAALDLAVAKLKTADREVIARRFYQGQSLETIGVAIGVSTEAARKRVSASLTRLQRRLAQDGQGINVPALLAPMAAMHQTTWLSPQSIATASLQPATVSIRSHSIAKGAFHMMIRDKVKTLAAGMAAFLVLATGVLMACATDAPPATAPASASTKVSKNLPRYILGTKVMSIVSPDGKQLVGLSTKTGAVARLDGKFDTKGMIMGATVAFYWDRSEYYAFSATTGEWAKLSLPNAGDPIPDVGQDYAMVETTDHLYIFTDASGKWTTIY